VISGVAAVFGDAVKKAGEDEPAVRDRDRLDRDGRQPAGVRVPPVSDRWWPVLLLRGEELYIYRMAFGTEGGSSAQRLGYASAAGVLFGVVLMIVGLVQLISARAYRRGTRADVKEAS